MSDLTRFRDHCRKEADKARGDDQALWAQLADEVDAYLANDPDVIQHELPVIDDDQLHLEVPC